MGESWLALQVLLILLSVLAGTPGRTMAVPTEGPASRDPTRVDFQAIETRGGSARSAALYDDGRVERWQETARGPVFQQEILWFDEAEHRELVTSAIRSGLPRWDDEASLVRFLRLRLDAARKASGEEERRVLLILQSAVDGSPCEVIRALAVLARQAISADYAEQLPEIGWAPRWATLDTRLHYFPEVPEYCALTAFEDRHAVWPSVEQVPVGRLAQPKPLSSGVLLDFVATCAWRRSHGSADSAVWPPNPAA